MAIALCSSSAKDLDTTDAQDDRALKRARVTLFRDRRYHLHTVLLIESKARHDWQAWSQSMNCNRVVHTELLACQAKHDYDRFVELVHTARDPELTRDPKPQDAPTDAEYEANRSKNGDDSHDSGSNERRLMPVARECTTSDFLKCRPLNFKGTEGVRMFLKESDEVEKYVGGLPDMIQGSCAPKCTNCKTNGHLALDYRNQPPAANNQRALRANQRVLSERTSQGTSLQDLPKIEQTVNEQLEAEVLTRSSNSSKTSYRNLYKALVEAYESNKIILDTYGDTVTLKRRRDDDADKDEEPFTGPNQGSKRRIEEKEPESASAPKEKATKSAGKSTHRSNLNRRRQASLLHQRSQCRLPLRWKIPHIQSLKQVLMINQL
uniref:Reverse transcriptase domain-containing protein n=1 Tax=Tanacetum cinerariifolium TaxID=118510 RepID=A0A699I328_TANCI|nr:hypothetical protein [Tanacetum cinerariifolium]